MIGSTLYTRDENRRSYKNDDGSKRSSPNPRFYWRAHTVTGETRNSWILDNGAYKADKKTLALRGIRDFFALDRYAYTEVDKEDRIWYDNNRYAIVQIVERADVKTLRQIAIVLDYQG